MAPFIYQFVLFMKIICIIYFKCWCRNWKFEIR